MNDRRARLLVKIKEQGGLWSTSRVWDLYREWGIAPKRSTARDDIAYLKRSGHLDQEGKASS